MRTKHLAIAALLAAACSSTSSSPPATDGPSSSAEARPVDGVAGGDGPRGDAPRPPADARTDAVKLDATKPDAAPPVGLPFPYTRPPAGTPVSASELAAVTATYVDLLKQTRYFAVLDERVHGWPQSDPKQRYWYGTWWSGVGIQKQGGKVSYVHVKAGADNNGLRSGPMLEGVCYAAALWGKPELEALARRMVRGFSSWILAMETKPSDPNGTLLTRASYPESITSTDGGRTIAIDYSASRPGDDNPATEYVHLAANPHWGDVWVKNKRSKDDIGHMLRAIAALGHCTTQFASAAAKQDYGAMLGHYTKWAKRVEDDGWAIATLDKSAKLWIPPLSETLAHFITLGNAECDAVLAIRLLGRGDPGTFACGNGIHALEWIALQNDHNGEIIRSFHEAAVANALRAKHHAVAQQLLPGLAARIEEGLAQYEAGKLPVHLDEKKLASLIILSATLGVPLTSREVRYVHKMIQSAHASYVSGASPKVYRIFDPGTPDGAYTLEPGGQGLPWVGLALPVGACSAQFLNPAGMPLLDCAKLKASFPAAP